MRVKLTEAQKVRVLNGKDLYGIMQRILKRDHKIDRAKEHFWVVALDGANRILLIELVGLGSADGVAATPSDIFAFALQKQTAKIILVHNHPTGDLEPSEQDVLQTSRLISVGQLVHCPVYDHLIISEKSFYSFLDAGMMQTLNETALDFTFGQADAWKEELEWLRKLAVEQEKKHALLLQTKELEFELKTVNMARALLRDGFEAERVAALTGLDVERVKGLAESV